MLKHITGKRVALLFILLMGSLIATPTYQYYMRQTTKAKIIEQGGKITYRAAYLQLPKFAGSGRYRLPGSFSTEVLSLELGTWSNGFTDLKYLGDFASVRKVVLRNPENISPEVYKFWKDKPWVQQIGLHGEGDFLKCLSHLSDSHFRQIELHQHELTTEEVLALQEMENLQEVKLVNTNGNPDAIKQLKQTNLNLDYVVDNLPSPEEKYEGAADFFKAYGPVDVLHWNYNPWSQLSAISETAHKPLTGKQLAVTFTSGVTSPDQATALWTEIDTSEMNLFVLDPLRSYYAFRERDDWPIGRMNNVKALRCLNTYGAGGSLDLNHLANMTNLESLELMSGFKVSSVPSLEKLKKLKRLIIPSGVPMESITNTILELPYLETVEVPFDSIQLSELEQLLQKPSLKALTFSSAVKATQNISLDDTSVLCKKYGWEINHVEKGANAMYLRFTLKRNNVENING